jgi:hypothetical protein
MDVRDLLKKHVLTFALAMLYLFMVVCYTSEMERRDVFAIAGHQRAVIKAHNYPVNNLPAKPKLQRIFKTVNSKGKGNDYVPLLAEIVTFICCLGMSTPWFNTSMPMPPARFSANRRLLLQLAVLRI